MKRIWDVEELVQCWSLSFKDLELLKSKPVRNHLGFVTQLKYYSLCGEFPQSPSDIPDTALHYVAAQLEIDSSRFNEYDWGGRTGKRHRQEILAFLGICCASTSEKQAFVNWLADDIFPHGTSLDEAIELALDWFQQIKMECPTEKELGRLVKSASRQFESTFYQTVEASLSIESKRFIN